MSNRLERITIKMNEDYVVGEASLYGMFDRLYNENPTYDILAHDFEIQNPYERMTYHVADSTSWIMGLTEVSLPAITNISLPLIINTDVV